VEVPPVVLALVQVGHKAYTHDFVKLIPKTGPSARVRVFHLLADVFEDDAISQRSLFERMEWKKEAAYRRQNL
jgi:hypothetical protein